MMIELQVDQTNRLTHIPFVHATTRHTDTHVRVLIRVH